MDTASEDAYDAKMTTVRAEFKQAREAAKAGDSTPFERFVAMMHLNVAPLREKKRTRSHGQQRQ